MKVDEILVAIYEQERAVLLDDLSEEEKELAHIIIHDLNIELKEMGYEVQMH